MGRVWAMRYALLLAAILLVGCTNPSTTTPDCADPVSPGTPICSGHIPVTDSTVPSGVEWLLICAGGDVTATYIMGVSGVTLDVDCSGDCSVPILTCNADGVVDCPAGQTAVCVTPDNFCEFFDDVHC